MGCANSKQKKRCKHCHRSPHSPVPRCYSMHVHHPPQHKGDSYHLVALTSTTLGSLKLDPSNQIHHSDDHPLEKIIAISDDDDGGKNPDDKTDRVMGNGDDHDGKIANGNVNVNGYVHDKEDKSKENSMDLIEAKTWSNMIQDKIPKIVPRTPIRTPPGEPETINTWELMEGLEDFSPLLLPNHFKSFSFDTVGYPNTETAPLDSPKLSFQANDLVSAKATKPIWVQIADEDSNSKSSFVQEFDPEVISTFRKSLAELPPDHPFYLRPTECEKHQTSVGNGDVLEYKRGKDKVVVYFTSLRGVRKTYEDCCHVRVILKGLGVRIDERDVSMHSGFKDELRDLLGDGFTGGGLPRVFVGRKYIGGAEEIRRMHEEGELEKRIEGCEMVDDGGGGGGAGGACEACGDIRFVPCETCSGSCKVYYECDQEDEEDDEGKDGEFGFQRCPDCNENGLIRCPICCY